MKTVFAINFDYDGNLMLQRLKSVNHPSSVACPFAAHYKPCGKWCIHCGDVEVDENGNGRIIITCGHGTEIREEGFVPPHFEGSADA